MSGASLSSIPSDSVAATAPKADETVLISLAAEKAVISKRVRRTLVRASRTTSFRDEAVEADLNNEQVAVERVAIGRIVDAVPPVRQDGDVTIISVVEEEVDGAPPGPQGRGSPSARPDNRAVHRNGVASSVNGQRDPNAVGQRADLSTGTATRLLNK